MPTAPIRKRCVEGGSDNSAAGSASQPHDPDCAEVLGCGVRGSLNKINMAKQPDGQENLQTSPPCAALGQPASIDAAAALPVRSTVELDAEALARLRALDPSGRDRLIARVVAAFSTSTRRMLPQLAAAAEAADPAALRHLAHTLKSSSANVGAKRLSGLCAAVELQLRQGRAESLCAAAAEIAAEIDAVDEALRRLPDAAA